LGYVNFQDAVPVLGINFVRIGARRQVDGSFKRAEAALLELAAVSFLLSLLLFLGPDGQDVAADMDIEILGLEAGRFGFDDDFAVFCNLLPSATLLPRHVPSFCTWWNGGLQTNYEWLELLETASRLMQRRGCALTEAHAALYRALFDQTALERHRSLQEAQQRSLRRSA
jgi:hypothetical protein